MFLDFKDLQIKMQPKRLTHMELMEEKRKLFRELHRDDIDNGLLHWIDELIDQAEESGYHGGYSDAHYYARREEDGA